MSADSNRFEPDASGRDSADSAQVQFRRAASAPHIGFTASVSHTRVDGQAPGEPLDCAEALNRVYLYLDGEIDAGTSAAARAHLEECVPCLREYGLEEEVKKLVRRACACDDVPSGLRDRVLLRLRQVTITLRYD